MKYLYNYEYEYKYKSFDTNEYLDLRYFDPLFLYLKNNNRISSYIIIRYLFDYLKSDIRILYIPNNDEDKYIIYTKCDIGTIKQILQDYIYNLKCLSDKTKDEISYKINTYENTSFKQ
jgi:hypothetical protein